MHLAYYGLNASGAITNDGAMHGVHGRLPYRRCRDPYAPTVEEIWRSKGESVGPISAITATSLPFQLNAVVIIALM